MERVLKNSLATLSDTVMSGQLMCRVVFQLHSDNKRVACKYTVESVTCSLALRVTPVCASKGRAN